MERGCWTEGSFITFGGPEAMILPVEKHFQERSAELQIPPLRSPGRDEKGEGSASIQPQIADEMTADSSASLGMTKGTVALP
jgi:hypothetical protein